VSLLTRRAPTHVLRVAVPLDLTERSPDFDAIQDAINIVLLVSRGALRGEICNDISVDIEEVECLTRVATSDNGGGAAYGWQAGAAVPCRVYPLTMRGQPRLIGARLDERTTHFCVTPPGTVAKPGQRFAIQNRGTFEVTIGIERSDSATAVFEVFELD
jgi:hypothetical protein